MLLHKPKSFIGEIKMKTLVIILILLGGCIEKKDSSKEDLATLVALSQLSNSAKACITNYTCTTAPSFSTLAAAGTNTTCGASGCHDNTTQQSGLVITDYNSTKAFTNPGNPCSRRMYTAISAGAMAGNSNATINKAVYCWIAGGSNP